MKRSQKHPLKRTGPPEVREFKPASIRGGTPVVPKARVLVLSYSGLSQLVHRVAPEFSDRALVSVEEVTLDDALARAQEVERMGAADVVISAGANAALLTPALRLPVVTIKVGGYDVLRALMRAREFGNQIGLGIYRERIPELDELKALLKVDVVQQTYESIEGAGVAFRRLRDNGIRVVVGSSLVVELAEKSGMTGILVYSLDSVREAFDQALRIAGTALLQAARYRPLDALLQNLNEAVCAVDTDHRITAINVQMERLLGIPHGEGVGRPVPPLTEELSLSSVLAGHEERREAVLTLVHRTFLMTQVAMREFGVITGAILTLRDAQAIQDADTVVRSQRKLRPLGAKYTFEDILGTSHSLQRAVRAAERCAHVDATVLVTGESGTGKELFAQAIHNASRRSEGPFVALNCAAFPESLLESELFGYEEGAFTGSRRGGKPGLFESAHRGTVFLDEIGDMPVALQTRLLRVLQEREVIRLGASQPIPVDVRVIAATHRDLRSAIATGAFRADLYYRLDILRVKVPPLRERAEDIDELARQLFRNATRRQGRTRGADRFPESVIPVLQKHDWPGNVRELENTMERLAAFGIGLSAADVSAFLAEASELAASQSHAPIPSAPLARGARARRRLEDHAIKSALELADGNRQLAADALGISRTTLWRKLQAHKA